MAQSVRWLTICVQFEICSAANAQQYKECFNLKKTISVYKNWATEAVENMLKKSCWEVNVEPWLGHHVKAADELMKVQLSAQPVLRFTHWGPNKWLTFYRQHFQMHFLERRYLYFDSNFTGVCPWGCSWEVNIASGNGMVLIKVHAVMWTNDGPVQWCVYVSLSLTELNLFSILTDPSHKYRCSKQLVANQREIITDYPRHYICFWT